MRLPVDPVERSVSEFQLLSGPPLWVTVLVLVPAILLVVGYVYRREAASASSRARVGLAMLRIAALVLVLLVLFQPVNRSQVFSETRSLVAFLLDESASMDRKEEYESELASRLEQAAGLTVPVDQVTRTQLVREVLTHAQPPLLDRLREKVDLSLVGFAVANRPIAGVDELVGGGEATAIGDAVIGALNDLRHRNLSSIVLITDGQSNRGRDLLEVARLAAAEGIPIHAVGVGNPSRPRNVAVLETVAPDVALVHDEVAVEVTLAAEGYDGEPAEVVIKDTGTGEELAQSSFTLSRGGGQQTETAYFKPEREGEYVLEISIPPRAGEQFVDDNRRVHHLRVEPEVVKVLYVEGRPRWEYRFLKALLLREENFKTQIWGTWIDSDVIQDSTDGVPALTRFPPTAQDLFQYDVLILGDVAPDMIDASLSRSTTEDLLREIKQFVEVGGGLIMVCGDLETPRSYRDTQVADVLAVEIGSPEEQDAENQDRRPFRPHLPDPLQPHGIVRMEKDLELNRRLLEDPEVGLAPLRWYAPVRRAKPGAEIILQHPYNANRYGPHVLMAATQYGDGRTLFVGFDETWLWRKPYEDRFTERFWRAAIRHVAIGKLRRSDKRFDLRTDKERYNLGELMELSLRLLDANFNPSQAENALIHMQREDEPVEDLLAYRQDLGMYERTVRADFAGTYRFWVEDASQGDKKLSQRTVEVAVPRLELLNPSLDQERLQSVASLTSGRYLGLHEAHQLADFVQGEARRIPIRTEQKDLWDRWEVLAALMGFLILEWAVRKRFNLL